MLAVPLRVACASGAVAQSVFLPSSVRSACVSLLSLYETTTAREPVAMGYCLRISKTIYSAITI